MPGPGTIFSDPFAPAPDTGDRPFELGPAPTSPAAGASWRPSRFTDPVTAARLAAALPADAPSPEEQARVLRLQIKTGLPVDFIRRHLAEVERESTRRDFNADTFTQRSPLFAQWLASDAAHAALVADDLVPMTALERTLHVARNTVGRLGVGFYGDFVRGVYGALAGVSEALAAPAIRAAAGAATPLPAQVLDVLGTPAAAHFFAGAAATAQRLGEGARGDERGAGFTEQALYTAAESLAASLPALALAPVGGEAAVLGAVGVTTGGQAYAQARAEGVAPPLAGVYGAVQGAIEIGTEYIPAHRLLGDLAEKTPLLQLIGHQILPELVGENVATVGQDLADWAVLPENANRTLGDYLRERPSAAAATTASVLLMLGSQAVVAHGTVRALEAFGGAARAAKTTTRAPEKVAAFLDGALADSPIATVSLPVDTFTQYWQNQREDPAARAAALTGDPEAYARARAAGTDLVVPIGRYVTQIGATEHATFFNQEARFDPAAPNVREAAAADRAVVEALRAAAEAPERPEAAVGETMRRRLEAIGLAPQTARTYATIAEATFGRLGARAGVDPVALFERYGLAISRATFGGADEGDRVYEQAPAPDTDAFRSWFGDSVVVDDTGAPRIAFHGTARDFDAFDLGRAGEGRGAASERALFFSLTPETANQAAQATGAIAGTGAGGLGSVVYPVYLSLQNPYVSHLARYDAEAMTAEIERAKAAGHDGILFPDLAHAGEADTVAVFDPRQVKSALANQGTFNPLDTRMLFQGEAPRTDGAVGAGEPIATLTGTELGPATAAVEDLRTAFVSAYERLRRPTADDAPVERAGLGRVEFSKKGRKHVLRYSANPDKLRLFPAVPAVIAQGVDLGREPARKARRDDLVAFRRFQGLVRLGERAVRVEVLVGERQTGGAVFYDVEPVDTNAAEDRPDKGPARRRGEDGPKTTLTQSVPPGPEDVKRGPRGRLTFGSDRQFRIELFAGADLSTLLHEMAHFHLEVLGDLTDELAAQDPTTLTDAQRGLVDDYRAVLDWLGVSTRAEIGTAQHEQFARGFEAYLLEGQAPNVQLRGVFARIRAWLTTVYRSVQQLRVDLTPEVRGVFDRLLATDDAIAAAEQQAGATVPLLTDEMAAAAGLTAAQREAYRTALAAALDQARQQVQSALLAQLQREHEAWWQQERDEVAAEIAQALAQQPVYRALALLQHGLDAEGQPLPEGVAFKIDTRALVDQFGADVLRQLPRPRVDAEGGLPPRVAAELLGFPSAQALVTALRRTPPLAEAARAQADAEMRRRHGDALVDGTLADTAAAAVLDARADVFAVEIDLLESLVTKQTGQAPVRAADAATIRAIADRRVGETRIGDLRPHVFRAAADRAGRKAIAAAAHQDFRGALAAKQQQLLNAELHRAAQAARDRLDEARANWARIAKPDPKLAPRYNIDLLAAARALLVKFQLAPKTLDVEHVWAYLAQVKDYAPDLFTDLQAAIDAAAQPDRPYRELTVDEFTSVADAIDNLVHLARRSKQVVIDGKAEDLDVVRGHLTARLAELHTPAAREGYARAQSGRDKARLDWLGIRAAFRRVEHWVESIDGGVPGVFRRILWNPVSEAATRYRLAKRDVLDRYLAVVKGVEPSLTRDEIAAPELGYVFKGKVELLHAMLHTGNESNLRRLLLGDSPQRPAWGGLTADGSLDTSRWDRVVARLQRDGVLTKADYDYLQGTWDLLESLKPDAQRAHHDLYGYFFSEITARPITTPWGVYRGGYVPAVYDPDLAEDVAIRQDKAALEQTASSFMFPTTGRGFTKARVEYARPLWLDLHVIPSHLDQVLRFIHLEPAVKDGARVVTDKAFRASLAQVDPAVGSELLVPWLQRTAKQIVETPPQGRAGRAMARYARTLRTRTGINFIAGNVLNGLQQLTGLSIAAVKVPPGALARSLFRYIRAPRQFAEYVAERSAFMKTKTTGAMTQVHQRIEDLLLNPSTYEKARRFSAEHAYVVSAGLQNIVDLVTWGGAYDHAVAGGATDVEAVRAADSAVRLTQGSGAPEDVAKIETGSAFERLFNQFYGYFNMQANLLGSEFSTAMRESGLRKGAGRALYLYVFGFLLPALLSDAIVRVGGGEVPEDEDDDGILDELLVWFFGTQVRTAAGFVPIVGPAVAAAATQFAGGSPYDDRLSVSPAISVLESAVRDPHEVYQAIVTGELSKRVVRDTLTTIGLLTGLPVAPLGRPLGYLADVARGREQPSGPLDTARGLVVGR